jgi:hypothetical protein
MLLGFTTGEIAWGATGIIVGALMFASQVGPEQAISNLSLWVQKAGVHAPAWLKARATDKWVFRVGFIVLLGLFFVAGIRLQPWLYPPAPPQIILVPMAAPSLPNSPTRLEANIPPPLPTDVADIAARYVLLRNSIKSTMEIKKIVEGIGPLLRDAMIPPPRPPSDPTAYAQYQNEIRNRSGRYQIVSMWREQWDANLKKLQAINDSVYKNRPIDLKIVPELAIPTMTAPSEEKFWDNDEKTQRDKYAYRAFHFLVGDIAKQCDSLVADMNAEQNQVEAALAKTAEGRDFLGPK